MITAEMLIRDLAEALKAEFAGDGDHEIKAVAPLEDAGPDELSFVANPKFAQTAITGRAGCLILPPGYGIPGRNLIFHPDPRAAVARVIPLLHDVRRPSPGVHPSAVVDPDAKVDPTASVGPFCFVGPACRVGAGAVLYARVTLYRNVSVGERTVLHSGVVLGADGFGFVWREDHYENFPQVGRVEIGCDVEIGANSCVDRAALGVTSIGDGTKLDNMVHIGHNCRIGKHVVIAAQTGLAGGVIVEDRAIIGGQVGFGDKARVEAGAVIGSGAGILTSKVVRAGEPVWGTPARPLRQYLRQLAVLSRMARK
jgi:UDP-3-O-[3-hydroxymyristoyl] glucosamine N-acyltransferase